jgi:hypothetical protein
MARILNRKGDPSNLRPIPDSFGDQPVGLCTLFALRAMEQLICDHDSICAFAVGCV